jgi:hypothetical protein
LIEHPQWSALKQILIHGATLPLYPITQDQGRTDLQSHFKRGNHQPAVEYKAMLDRIMEEDKANGFCN